MESIKAKTDQVASKYLKRFKLIWIIFIVVVVVIFIVPLIYNVAQADKIYPGVRVGSLSVGGSTAEEAEKKLRESWDKVAQAGWLVELTDGSKIILPTAVISSSGPDFSYGLVSIDIDYTIDNAVNWGKTGNIFTKLWGPVWARLFGLDAGLVKNIDHEQVLTFLKDNFIGLEKQPQAADFSIDAAGNLQVVPEQAGTVINDAPFFKELDKRLNNFSNEALKLEASQQSPDITEIKVAKLLPQARAMQVNKIITLTDEDKKWQLDALTWQGWIGVEKTDGELQVALTKAKSEGYFNILAQAVNKSAQDAKFDIENGRVKQFQSSQNGRTLQVEPTLLAINNLVKSNGGDEVQLIVITEEAQVSTGEANDLGIAELIGVGRSNFAGSPNNRRHNIKVGADTLNGILIKPGEEFSLIKALGAIDGEHGYLQELVIKGNRTIPEYGGGLCQIGTTAFRVALDTGLPIVERRNHSYRVVYYEPAGTDATIYDPKPDFRFNNDTGRAILIQTKILGDELVFEFWGTKDGRQVNQTTPRIFNITSPAPTKLIETEDLPVGVKRCTERAHNGADTEFTYTVTYASGETKQEVFKSHYIPWQEVCLIGVPKGSLQPTLPDGSVLPPDPAAQTIN